MEKLSGRVFFVSSALIAVAGSFLMNYGGRHHPTISEAMGPLGTPPFYRSFARLMAAPDWQSVHAQITSGPVLWAIGSVGLVAWLRARGDRYWSTAGLTALAMGGVVWILTYLNDGYVSPLIAPRLLEASPADANTLTVMFAASQQATLALALPGWLLIAGGTALISIGILSTFTATASVADRVLTVVLGVSGFLFGAWPAIAKLSGDFEPGPMLSPWWAATASGMQLWFAVFAAWVAIRQFRPVPARADRAPAVTRSDTVTEELSAV